MFERSFIYLNRASKLTTDQQSQFLGTFPGNADRRDVSASNQLTFVTDDVHSQSKQLFLDLDQFTHVSLRHKHGHR